MKDFTLYYSVLNSFNKKEVGYDRYYHKLVDEMNDDKNSNKD